MQPASLSGIKLEISIDSQLDVIHARNAVRRLASEMGFQGTDQWKIAIAVSELADNMVKFAGKGTIRLLSLSPPDVGIEIIAVDDGPGISDVTRAMDDGFSEGRYLFPLEGDVGKRGLGSGIPAIMRMMDRVEIINREEGGLTVIAAKLLG